jgi:hypothetical protein
LYDAGNHYAFLEFILSASLTPAAMTGVFPLAPGYGLLTPEMMTRFAPSFQEHVQQFGSALEPLGIEDSLEWLELSADDPVLRSGSLSRFYQLYESLVLRFNGDHIFFAVAMHARHYLSSRGLFIGERQDCWAVQMDTQLQHLLEFTTILRIRHQDQERIVRNFVTQVDNLGSNAEYALTTLMEAILESSEEAVVESTLFEL